MKKERLPRKAKKHKKMEQAIMDAHNEMTPFNQVKPEDAGAFYQDALKNQHRNGFGAISPDWLQPNSVRNGFYSSYEGEDIAQ